MSNYGSDYGFNDKEVAVLRRYIETKDRALEDILEMALDDGFTEKELTNFELFLRHGYSAVSA